MLRLKIGAKVTVTVFREKVKLLKIDLVKKVQERSQRIKEQAAELIRQVTPKQPK